VRYLIVSDIHANWHALEAVLEDAEGAYDRVICCGDLVGYCADPNPVVDWARSNAVSTVRGNHDKACAGLENLEWFNPIARSSAVWTIGNLTRENGEYLREMPKGPQPVNGFHILHGSPADEDDYLTAPAEVALVRERLSAKLTFFGHTHVQGGFLIVRNGVLRIPRTPSNAREQTLGFENDVHYLVNPGAVGQPRDGDPRAAYILYDSDSEELTYRRVAYDVAGAQAKIRAAHLPDVLADRLAAGT
jgi:predicted phosphodiesterase